MPRSARWSCRTAGVVASHGYPLIRISRWPVTKAPSGHDFIRTRAREALQVKKENGVALGKPRQTPDDVLARVVRERIEAKTAYTIARDLNTTLCRLPRVRAWSLATVRALLMREGVH